MLIYLQVIDAPEDRDQFITLYETYRGLMFYVANQILQNEQDAEDAVHDAFFCPWRNISKNFLVWSVTKPRLSSLL